MVIPFVRIKAVPHHLIILIDSECEFDILVLPATDIVSITLNHIVQRTFLLQPYCSENMLVTVVDDILHMDIVCEVLSLAVVSHTVPWVST